MRVVIATVMLVLGGGLASAQVLPTPGGGSALGVTSPLGTPGSIVTGGPTGIPLGSVEINNGGLSPAPVTPLSSTANCFASTFGMSGTTASGTASAGIAGIGSAPSNSTFDGGGTAGLSAGTPMSLGSPSLSGGCAAMPTGAAGSPGTASPLATPGSPGLTTLNGGTIPLGATELNSAGVSPLVPVPGPTISAGMTSSGMTLSGP